MKDATELECPGCGVKFTRKRSDQKYHDAKCRQDHWFKTHPRMSHAMILSLTKGARKR